MRATSIADKSKTPLQTSADCALIEASFTVTVLDTNATLKERQAAVGATVSMTVMLSTVQVASFIDSSRTRSVKVVVGAKAQTVSILVLKVPVEELVILYSKPVEEAQLSVLPSSSIEAGTVTVPVAS